MKVLSAILFFSLSSSSFAGLFGENLNCDLSVSPYSDRVVSSKIETKEIKIIRPYTVKDISPDILTISEKKAQEKILENNDEASKVFNQEGTRIKSCTSVVAGKTAMEIVKVTDTILGSKSRTQTVTPLKLDCTIETLDKKNSKEMAEALCQRAMQCASSADSTEKLKSHNKLKDDLCGKNSDAIVPTAEIDSSSRKTQKENAVSEESYGSPAQTTSK